MTFPAKRLTAALEQLPISDDARHVPASTHHLARSRPTWSRHHRTHPARTARRHQRPWKQRLTRLEANDPTRTTQEPAPLNKPIPTARH